MFWWRCRARSFSKTLIASDSQHVPACKLCPFLPIKNICHLFSKNPKHEKIKNVEENFFLSINFTDRETASRIHIRWNNSKFYWRSKKSGKIQKDLKNFIDTFHTKHLIWYSNMFLSTSGTSPILQWKISYMEILCQVLR